MMVPSWIPIIIRHLIFRVPPKRDHDFDNHSYGYVIKEVQSNKQFEKNQCPHVTGVLLMVYHI